MGKLDCMGPVRLIDDQGFQLYVPCNHCVNCQIKRQMSWTLRICLEQRSTGLACFVTNTYEEMNRPGFLDYRHMQLSIKRLRKSFPTTVRFFSCGQYGSRHGREHWHTIFFGVSPEQMAELLGTSYSGIPGLQSQGLAPQPTKLWPHGSTHITDFNIHRARYVARYALKTGTRDEKRPNVVQMSRRPGIGLDEIKRIGSYLATVRPSWDSIPGWWKLGGSLYPLDDTARAALATAFKSAGGTILHETRSALSLDRHARLMTLCGDAILPGAAVDVRRLERKELERSVF